MTSSRSRLLLVPFVLAALALAVGASGHRAHAQTTPALSDEALLSMVLPPLADGSRPPVHFWARADQADGPGGLPTAFIVTLYTHQTDTGSDQREVVNYAQYSGGSWAPARAQDAGTLLTDDWAWVSLNLTNLSAAAQGQGDASRYTVDYEAKGNYNGTPRDLVIEEVYGADLGLISSNIVSDTSGGSVAAATAIPTATTAPSVTAVATAMGAPAPAATAAPSPSVSATPAAGSTIPAAQPPASATSAAAAPAPTQASVGAASSVPNTIHSATPAGADAACAPALAAAGYTSTGQSKSLGAIAGQPVVLCLANASASTPSTGQSFGCLLVGGQTATLDGSPACLAFSTIQPQGDGNFLVVQPSSANSAEVQPINWSAGGFASGQSYTACTANIAIPVNDTSSCSSGG
ncbi:MAG TPA: hypothetical protein VND24_05710 [Steroidobacteraceae bacterium]|nr:hypothetical protein [Steroidobacteraceae bacterium]